MKHDNLHEHDHSDHRGHDHGHAHDVKIIGLVKIGPTRVKVSVEIPQNEVAEEKQRVTKGFAGSMKVAGFRPGKAPLHMVAERMSDEIQRKVYSHLLNVGVDKAIRAAQSAPLDEPSIQLKKDALEGKDPFQFDVEFDVRPEIELRNYRGVPLKKSEVEPTDQEISAALENLRDRFAVIEPCESESIQNGQLVAAEVSFQLESDPAPRPNETVRFEMGKNQILGDLEAAFHHKHLNESMTVKTAFPADYWEESLKGQPATFTVKVVEIKRKTLSDLNDAFAETVLPGQTLEQLRTKITEELRSKKSQQAREVQKARVLEHLVKTHEFPVPDSMIQNQTNHYLQELAKERKTTGTVPDLPKEQLDALRKRAEQVSRASLLLGEIALKEKIIVDEEKVRERVRLYAKGLKRSVDETTKTLSDNGLLSSLRQDILTEQVFDFILENANLTP